MLTFVKGIDLTLSIVVLFFKDFIYLTERESQVGREAGRGRGLGGGRLPAEQGARCGARSQDPEIMT